MSKNFKRTVEDFECQNCGEVVEGNGYTNHCPKCLYSLHVDINPGDRVCECKGLMEPFDIGPKEDHFILTHKCLKCGHIMKTRTQDNDNITVFIENLPVRFPKS